MNRLRHALVVRFLVLLVGAGLLGVLAPPALGAPARRTAAWLRTQAVDADAEAFEAALAVALSRGNLAPRAFLDAYGAAQPRFGDPTGAWFGRADLSFRAALDRLRERTPAGFDAPAARTPLFVPGAVASATVPAAGAAAALLPAPHRLGGASEQRAATPVDGPYAVPAALGQRAASARAP